MEPSPHLCPSEALEAAASQIGAEPQAGLATLEALLETYPADPRLGFLRGSLLAGLGRFDEARRALAAVVELAPDYAIARFQFGLLLLSSGEPEAAARAWAPLRAGAPDDPLRLFAEGLDHLAHDRFDQAESLLTQGIALNHAWPAVNDDMRRVLAAMRPQDQSDETVTSSVEWLLRASAARTEH